MSCRGILRRFGVDLKIRRVPKNIVGIVGELRICVRNLSRDLLPILDQVSSTGIYGKVCISSGRGRLVMSRETCIICSRSALHCVSTRSRYQLLLTVIFGKEKAYISTIVLFGHLVSQSTSVFVD